jgi:hypothetical protein
MTEAEWLTSMDPRAMLDHLRTQTERWTLDDDLVPAKQGDRKLRLFACACCRQVWDELTAKRSQLAVVISEMFADGQVTEQRLLQASREAEPAANSGRTPATIASWAAYAIPVHACRVILHEYYQPIVQAGLLRDIFGNPFRMYGLSLCGGLRYQESITCRTCIPCQEILSWNNGTIPKLAQAIYDDRNFADMPILGDALEEAGCTNEEILQHCFRDVENWRAVVHVRGCWVLDLLLLKE